jgi:hypothetical protein
MAQQTAVEWLDNQLWKLRLKLRVGEVSIDFYCEQEVKLIEQAKAMEKEQIMSAYDLGNQNQYNKICISNYVNIDEEQYYNETYNKWLTSKNVNE